MHQLFTSIVSKGAKSNTYKFALAKFLLDYSKSQKLKEQDYQITYNEIATKFLEYYWFQECKYKFKQDFNKDKVPVVIGIIQKHCGTEYISDSYENYFKERQELQQKMISEIEKKSLNNVIPRFQPQEQHDYYQHFHDRNKGGRGYKSSSKKYIILKYEALKFFKENYETLSKVLVLEWAKFLEKTNFTPKLISKIELMKDPKRSSLTKFREVLLKMDRECFYCTKLLEDGNIHIDHFIPWSYIYEDVLWNLVPACSRCNLIKSDALPPKACMEKIITRNQTNKLITWNSNIEEYYENCYSAGFQIVNGGKLGCKDK
jgi:hypothetical protein